MSGDNLKKLQAGVSDAVAKLGLEGVRGEVVLVLDVSRSMFPIYRAKIVQELVPQFCAVALNFDDDGIIPAYAFGDACRHLRDLRATDFQGWVDREVIRTGSDYQTHCRYAPVIHEVCRYYFPEDWDRPALKETVGRLFKKEQVVYPMLSAPRAYPVFCMFVTGGDCEDEEETSDAIRRSSRLPIFWQFIGLSPPGRLTQYRFLKRLDKLGNTHVDNCGFFEPGDVRNSAALHRGLLNELPQYLSTPAVRLMLDPDDGLETRGERPQLRDEDEELDQLTAMPEEPDEPSVIIAAMDDEAPDPNRDLDALKQKFAGVEWAEGTHGGAGAVRAAAPLMKAPAAPVESSISRRRLKPSEVAALEAEEAAAIPKEDSKARVQQRLASLKSKLSDIQEDVAPAPAPRPQPAAPTPRAQPAAPAPRPQPAARPQPAPRAQPAPVSPAPSEVEALRARLASFGEDSGTVAATGIEVDQEGLPPGRPQPPPRAPAGRPQPPPRRSGK